MLQRWPVWFFHFVNSFPSLPNQCLVCRSWPSTDVVCPDCLQRFAPAVFRCTGCALPLPGLSPEQPRCGACLRKPPVWHSAHAWVDYGYPWSQLIPRWKFAGQPALAAHLARWMRAHAAIAQRIAAADVLIPVPLSPTRMRERGYNQAALLARHLDATKCQLHSLQRVQHTTAQSSSTRAQRLRNLRHAFAVAEAHRAQITGQRIVLVDDVMTTGATLHAATRALLQAGAAQVDVLCVARTP